MKWRQLAKFLIGVSLLVLITACNSLPRVTAEERMFLKVSLEFLDDYELTEQTFSDTRIGGLSSLTYDRATDRFYVLSDDRSQFAPARFYTLKLNLDTTDSDRVKIDRAILEKVTFLKNQEGQTYPRGSIDAEGIALSPRNTLFISSEGAIKQGIAPFMGEFDLKSGQLKQPVPLPQRYFPDSSDGKTPRGIQDNLGFEPLTLSITSTLKDDPFRLFTATELALLQDSPSGTIEENRRVRLLHYVINPFGSPAPIAEHLYEIDPPPDDVMIYGLVDLATLDREGYFLSLERTLSLSGFGAKIFQVVNSNATDTTTIATLANAPAVVPLKKKLLLDLGELDIDLDNLEAMSPGPHLPDGSPSLVLISDNNFKDEQVTQLLLFRLVEK